MPAVQILPKKQLQIGHEHTKKLSLPHILGKGRWHRWELMKFCKKGSCLRARNSWDEETTKTSPSTRLRKQSPMNFPNKYYCIFSQPRQIFLSLLYTLLSRQIFLSLFIQPTNTYGVLCSSGLGLGNQVAEVTKAGLCLQRERQLQSVLPRGESSYSVWIN